MARRAGRVMALVGGIVFSPLAMSAENMSFHGTLVEYQPCIINDGGSIDVDFSDIFIEQVNGVNYSKSLTLDFTCDTPQVPPLSLRHLGSATTFDTAAVQSNVANFGIHVDLDTVNGTVPFTVGEAFILSHQEAASLQTSLVVTPTKKSGATLQSGVFTATSTLQIEYQ